MAWESGEKEKGDILGKMFIFMWIKMPYLIISKYIIIFILYNIMMNYVFVPDRYVIWCADIYHWNDISKIENRSCI